MRARSAAFIESTDRRRNRSVFAATKFIDSLRVAQNFVGQVRRKRKDDRIAALIGDDTELASLFTEDAIYAANTGEVLTGRDEIRSGVAAWMQGSSHVGQQRANAALDVQRRSLRFRQAGSLGYDLLRFTISMNPPGCLIDAGHALAVWEKQPDGRWLIDALTVNQDKAPPPNACRRS